MSKPKPADPSKPKTSDAAAERQGAPMSDRSTDRFVDNVAEKAMAALRAEEPENAARMLREVLRESPERIDLMHALAITELRLGDPTSALATARHAAEIAAKVQDETANMLMPQLKLVEAAACEDLGWAEGAAAAFREVLEHEEENPRARSGLGHLLISWGRLKEGLGELDRYLEDKQDEPQFMEGTEAFVDCTRAFIRDDIHPKEFLAAHRGSYVQMFDHFAEKMEAEGWIAEAARMARDEDGRVVPVIPDGARPYAAVRVDLVNPATGQPGRIGDQPMIVALAAYQPMAQGPVTIEWPPGDWPFRVSISSQCPWNDLTIAVRLADVEAATPDLDAVVGDWYSAGFEGAFGSTLAGRLHEIGDFEPIPEGVRFSVDCGRAELGAVDDLLRRLTVLHGRHTILGVHFGRGYPPTHA